MPFRDYSTFIAFIPGKAERLSFFNIFLILRKDFSNRLHRSEAPPIWMMLDQNLPNCILAQSNEKGINPNG
jgi:hypothetical protein